MIVLAQIDLGAVGVVLAAAAAIGTAFNGYVQQRSKAKVDAFQQIVDGALEISRAAREEVTAMRAEKDAMQQELAAVRDAFATFKVAAAEEGAALRTRFAQELDDERARRRRVEDDLSTARQQLAVIELRTLRRRGDDAGG